MTDKENYGSIILPVWFLELERKYLKYNSRKGFSFVFILIAIYSFIPLFNAETPITTTIDIEMIIIYYSIFYIIFFGIVYIYWRFFFKPYKIKEIEVLACKFYKVGLNLEEVNFNLTLDIKLKRNIDFLIRGLKQFRRKYSTNLDSKYEYTLDTVMDNINKLYDYKTDKVKDLIANDRLPDKFFEIGETLIETKEYTTIQKQMDNLGTTLEDIAKIKISEKYFLDLYTSLGVLAVVILLCISFIISEHQTVIASVIGALLTLVLLRIFGKSNI